jgi:hypothetical protein
MKNKRKKQFFWKKSVLFYYRRFGHLSDHYQYNKLSKNATKQKTKLKTVIKLFNDLSKKLYLDFLI